MQCKSSKLNKMLNTKSRPAKDQILVKILQKGWNTLAIFKCSRTADSPCIRTDHQELIGRNGQRLTKAGTAGSLPNPMARSEYTLLCCKDRYIWIPMLKSPLKSTIYNTLGRRLWINSQFSKVWRKHLETWAASIRRYWRLPNLSTLYKWRQRHRKSYNGQWCFSAC